MDWKELWNKANIWKDRATEVAKKTYMTSKEYAEKTGIKSYEALKKSQFSIRTVEAFETEKAKKRLVLFCIQDNHPFTKDFLIQLPVLFTKAWIESGSIRIVPKEGSDELRKILEVDSIPFALVYRDGECVRKISGDSDLQMFMRDFSFYGE